LSVSKFWLISSDIFGNHPGIPGIIKYLTGNKYINLFLLMAEEFKFAAY